MTRFDGAKLRVRRKHLHLTLDELARLSSLPYAALMTMERDETRPSITALERLCGALDCTPDMFFTAADGDDEADPRPTELGRDIDEWVERAVAAAPPMTRRQAETISAALFGTGATR
jgi:transcriptional regulator with XRE-family HTH domain